VPRFREQHKDVTISLNLSDRVIDLAGESYDCAVRVGDMPDSSLVTCAWRTTAGVRRHARIPAPPRQTRNIRASCRGSTA
jgi:DNA-binding transcriptional LysR family regulator